MAHQGLGLLIKEVALISVIAETSGLDGLLDVQQEGLLLRREASNIFGDGHFDWILVFGELYNIERIFCCVGKREQLALYTVSKAYEKIFPLLKP